MATRKPTDKKHADALPGEDEIAHLYQAGGSEMPPPVLDAHITTEAYRTVTLNKPKRHWAVPLSTAAVVVLAVSVVLLMTKQGTLDRDGAWPPLGDEYTAPSASAPVALGEAAHVEAKQAPAKAKSVAPAAPPAELADAATAPMKKSEAKPAAAAPLPEPLRRSAEADQRVRATREEKARAPAPAIGALAMKSPAADVTAVAVSGSPGAYTFNVTVKSPDTGCQQYADWWEVVSEDGKLLYRRVLLHSHVDEQPFTRSGGPVLIKPDTVVWVRAHMNTTSYGGVAFKGSVKTGFKPAMPNAGFAVGLAKQPPLPEGCDF
jgi:hypothetical protein